MVLLHCMSATNVVVVCCSVDQLRPRNFKFLIIQSSFSELKTNLMLKFNHSLMICCCLMSLLSCAQEISNQAFQIGGAVMAAPEDLRADATVLGYDDKGTVVTLREGDQ